MFTCQRCRQPSKPYEQSTRVVIATRTKVYPLRTYAQRPTADEPRWTDDPRGGTGTEIVREKVVCGTCAGALEGAHNQV